MGNKIEINQSLQEKYNLHFQERYKEFGENIKTLWGGVESQRQRFDVLLTIGNMSGKSILDVGCGFGDLYDEIRRRKYKSFKYTGLDINQAIIEVAKNRYPNISFQYRDILKDNKIARYDYAVASGIFFLPDERWESYMIQMVNRMFSISKIGVGVNFLSSFSTKKDGFSYYAHPSFILSMIMKNITSKTVLKHDYRLNDFTIFLYK